MKPIHYLNATVLTKPRLAEMEEFLSAVKTNPERERKELFMDTFKLTEEKLETMLFFGLFNLYNDIVTLEKQLNKMKMLAFENFIKEELDFLQEHFPSYKPIQFELFILDDNDYFVREKLGGVSAFTDWDGNICFAVLPNESVRETLRAVINHEYHHHWRINQLKLNEEKQTLLERMLMEGLAEHFVKIRLGDAYLGPYKDALTENQARILWSNTYKHHLYDSGQETDSYMFGNEEKGLPFWGGYSLGYYLVKWYVEKNKEVSMEELTLLPANHFIV